MVDYWHVRKIPLYRVKYNIHFNSNKKFLTLEKGKTFISDFLNNQTGNKKNQ